MKTVLVALLLVALALWYDKCIHRAAQRPTHLVIIEPGHVVRHWKRPAVIVVGEDRYLRYTDESGESRSFYLKPECTVSITPLNER